MTISVCVAGATGWAGRAVAEAVHAADDLELTSAVARRAAGKDLGVAWEGEPLGIPVHATVAEGLEGVDVLVDYTSHESILEHTLTALEHGVGVVIGSSGLSASDLDMLEERAIEHETGVFAGGNFSLTATLAGAAAMLAARFLPSWEIVDYASAAKPDAPSGTSREIAERLAEIRPPAVERSVEETGGLAAARGVTVAGTQIHSVRLPSYELKTEIIFGLPDERLEISHVSGFSPQKFVAGTLMAVRATPGLHGLVRGIDGLLLGDEPRPEQG